MPEHLDPRQQALADQADAFARDVLLPLAEQTDARTEVIRASREAGFFTMTQPADYGGSEASALDLTLVRDQLAAHNPPYLDAVFGPGPGVLANCGEPLASEYLQPLMAGEKRGAFGFTEPEAHPTTGALDGDQLTINGQKSYVTGGAHADFINTLVRIEGYGPAMVVVDTAAAGLTEMARFSSLDGSHHAAFEYRDVTVPASRIIGGPGEGMPRAMRQIGDTRLLIAAQCVGLMRWTINHVREHLEGTDRSGAKRGERESVRLRYADLRIRAYAARSMLYRTARIADSGDNSVNESIACKVFATETVGLIVDEAIQLVGGNALVSGHPLEALYRRVRSWRLAEGASDVIRLNLARGDLELDKGRL